MAKIEGNRLKFKNDLPVEIVEELRLGVLTSPLVAEEHKAILTDST
ncbi:MAG: hypothetical protein AB9873_13485 [Syntrophobacteraceae bacterium]